jgi:hypothetical protein
LAGVAKGAPFDDAAVVVAIADLSSRSAQNGIDLFLTFELFSLELVSCRCCV